MTRSYNCDDRIWSDNTLPVGALQTGDPTSLWLRALQQVKYLNRTHLFAMVNDKEAIMTGLEPDGEPKWMKSEVCRQVRKIQRAHISIRRKQMQPSRTIPVTRGTLL